MAVISAPVDVLGVNFYTRSVVSSVGQQIPFGTPKTEMGWEIHAPSLRNLLVWLHETYAPEAIVITENGCAMADRSARAEAKWRSCCWKCWGLRNMPSSHITRLSILTLLPPVFQRPCRGVAYRFSFARERVASSA